MVTTTVLASTGSLFLRLTSAAAASAASGQLSAALAGGARHFSSSASGSELKAHLAAQIPAQQVGRPSQQVLDCRHQDTAPAQQLQASEPVFAFTGASQEPQEAVWGRQPWGSHGGHGHRWHARHPCELQPIVADHSKQCTLCGPATQACRLGYPALQIARESASLPPCQNWLAMNSDRPTVLRVM